MSSRYLNREKQWCHGKLKGSGYRMTAGREAIMNALSDADAHLSAEDIYMKIHSVFPAI